MLFARVEGNLTATRRHSSLRGWRLLICQPLNGGGNPVGTPVVAIDPYGAGMHQHVIITSDGTATREAVGDHRSPLRMMIIGIVDEAATSPTATSSTEKTGDARLRKPGGRNISQPS